MVICIHLQISTHSYIGISIHADEYYKNGRFGFQ